MDPLSQEIGTYEWRVSTPYPSPAYQVTPDFGPYGVPYWMRGFPIQQCYLDLGVEAPTPYAKSVIFQPAGNYHNAGQYAFGAAPTEGIYTGVEG